MVGQRFRESFEIGRATRNINVRGHFVRLAGVAAFGFEKFIETLVDALGHFVEQLDARGLGELAPRLAQGGAGCGHGGIHFFPARFVHKPYQAVVHGAAVFKSFAALRADIHAVDKMFEFLHGWFPE